MVLDSSSFFQDPSTTSTTSTTTTESTTSTTENTSARLPRYPSWNSPREEDFRRDFLKIGSDIFRKKKNPFTEGLYIRTRPHKRPPPPPPPSPAPPSSRPAHVVTVTDPSGQSRQKHSDKTFRGRARRIVMEMTPLTIGAVSVGVLVLVLLLISVVTLIVSRARRSGRRRAQHTRCQLAIRQFDAISNSLAKDNGGYSEDQSSHGPPPRALPRSTYSLLECPVCLEIAWPPKKIYQCREGHIVCDTCKANPNLKTCPMCRISFSNNLTSRNR